MARGERGGDTAGLGAVVLAPLSHLPWRGLRAVSPSTSKPAVKPEPVSTLAQSRWTSADSEGLGPHFCLGRLGTVIGPTPSQRFLRWDGRRPIVGSSRRQSLPTEGLCPDGSLSRGLHCSSLWPCLPPWQDPRQEWVQVYSHAQPAPTPSSARSGSLATAGPEFTHHGLLCGLVTRVQAVECVRAGNWVTGEYNVQISRREVMAGEEHPDHNFCAVFDRKQPGSSFSP